MSVLYATLLAILVEPLFCMCACTAQYLYTYDNLRGMWAGLGSKLNPKLTNIVLEDIMIRVLNMQEILVYATDFIPHS